MTATNGIEYLVCPCNSWGSGPCPWHAPWVHYMEGAAPQIGWTYKIFTDGEETVVASDRSPWQCPGCNRWKAPHVDECGCGDGVEA